MKFLKSLFVFDDRDICPQCKKPINDGECRTTVQIGPILKVHIACYKEWDKIKTTHQIRK